jgi:hypothetical protein
MALSRTPKVLKAGLIVLDPETTEVQRVIALQYNPETLSHGYEIRGAGEGNHSEPLRLIGPPIETFTLEAFLDASDQLEHPDDNREAVEHGIQGAIAVLETLIYPESEKLIANRALADQGKLEIVPMEKNLTLFVWGRDRVVPVRITQFSLNEEDFSPELYPLRARISLTLRVLSVDDLGFEHRGGSLYLRYQQTKERAASRIQSADLETLGSVSID